MLDPVLEEGEIFDSNKLKDTINAEIAQGNRNFAIDFSSLDYVYSDTINVLLALNRRILDVSGRLSLLSPGPEVMQVLRKTGVHNILKVYDSEMDLLRSSEDIILQTSSFKLTDIQKYAEQGKEPPESEFDDMRSELGTSFGQEEAASPQQAAQEPPAPSQPAPAAFGPQSPSFEPPQPQQPPQGYGQGPSAPPPGPSAPPPSYQAPPQQQGYAPPPPPPQSGYQTPGGVPPHMVTPSPGYQPPQQQYGGPSGQSYQQPPPPPPPSYEADTPSFEAPPPPPSREAPSDNRPKVREFDRFGEDIDDSLLEERKKSPVLAVLITLVAIGAVTAGAIFGIKYYLEQSQGTQAKSAIGEGERPSLPVVPAVPETTSQAADAADEEEAEEPEAKKASRVTRRRRPATTTTARRRTPRRSTRRTASRSRPKASTPVPSKNKLTITSSPPGAVVKIDGKTMGTTPYEWNSPFFGGMRIQVSKAGYEDATKSMEYLGGSKSVAFTLDRSATTSRATTSRATTSRATTTSARAAAAPPPTTSAASTSSSAPAASSGGGDPATIFIASIPPVADVYMDGKLIGKTNVSEMKVTAGTHTMKFVKGGKEVVKKMTFQPGKNPSQMIRIP